MPAPYSAIAVANAFIEIAQSRGVGISPMKLQKLVYFAHAWYLAVRGQPLINEPVYAWKFGPVIKSVYHEFKSCGYGSIPFFGTVLDLSEKVDDESNFGFVVNIPTVEGGDSEVNSLVQHIWSVYGGMTARKLSDLTHEEGTPWGLTESIHSSGAASDYELPPWLIQESMMRELGLPNRLYERVSEELGVHPEVAV